MISKETVKTLIEEWLEGKDYFLADLTISADNRIVVEIDHEEGVWIEDCVALSRHIEDHLDRDAEDFELEVGSAGIGQPFKVLRQYEIHIGDDVEVLTTGGQKIVGTLAEVSHDGITVITVEKVKHEGEKRPRLEEVEHPLTFQEIKWTKLYIDFK